MKTLALIILLAGCVIAPEPQSICIECAASNAAYTIICEGDTLNSLVIDANMLQSMLTQSKKNPQLDCNIVEKP